MHSTYLLLSGIELISEVDLGDGIVLQPANTTHLNFETAISTASSPDDLAVIIAHIPVVTAQLKITASDQKELAIQGWNAMWDALLISAAFNVEIGFNLYSSDPANIISKTTKINASNRRFHGVNTKNTYKISTTDIDWISRYYKNAKTLMSNDRFNTAVHCLASYRWHGHPRVQLAILWAGIESLFGASTEIKFRISLYIAKYLHYNDDAVCRKMFEEIKKMYDRRSAAVHGSSMKGDTSIDVSRSSEILQLIILKTSENNSLPDIDSLVP